MALTESKMIDLGIKAPSFKLKNTVSEEMVSLYEIKSNVATVIGFICNHCPFVKHINESLISVANTYQKKGVIFIAISSNSIKTHPQDGPEFMAKTAKELGYPFPYLYDETQDVAKSYHAECTPDFFVYNSEMLSVYRGRFDETRPEKGIATGKDLAKALDFLLDGKEVPQEQYPSIGCNIKWEN